MWLRLLGISFFVALAACGNVRPWQRGFLVQSTMDPQAPDRLLSEAFFSHIFDVREGATGGIGHAGGGCGCN